MTGAQRVAIVFTAAMLGAVWVRADLTDAKSDPNLEKRTHKALDNADRMLDAAMKAYKGGDWQKTWTAIEEVRDSVQLAYVSLKETGKDPRKKPRHFKAAEIRTRNLLRNLEDFRLRMGLDERESIEPIRKYIQQVHDDLLEGIMGTGQLKSKS